jgi:hypothetical protein
VISCDPHLAKQIDASPAPPWARAAARAAVSTSASAPPKVEIAISAGAPSAAAQSAHEQRQARAHLWGEARGRRGERLHAEGP